MAFGGGGSVVLSNDTVLDARAIATRRVLPELMFINCCHLGQRSEHLSRAFDRVTFAAGMAEELIRIGAWCRHGRLGRR
jgi:hypothetical protein